MFLGPMMKTIDTIDCLDVGVESGEQGIRLAITASPLKIATAGLQLARGMPPGVLAASTPISLLPIQPRASATRFVKAFNNGFVGDSN